MIFNLKDFIKYSDTFIETGSGVGDGIQRATDAGFKFIISIEAQKEYYDICRRRNFKNETTGFIPTVALYHGKSEDKLADAILFATYQCVFFLDAHPAGEGSFGHEDVIQNGSESQYAQDKIIRKELEIIFKSYNQHVIIIDDINGLGKDSANYIQIILKANRDYSFAFYDECLGGVNTSINKLLVATPKKYA